MLPYTAVISFCGLFQIVRLQYTYSGAWLFALDTNGKHKLWKWTGDNCVVSFPNGQFIRFVSCSYGNAFKLNN